MIKRFSFLLYLIFMSAHTMERSLDEMNSQIATLEKLNAQYLFHTQKLAELEYLLTPPTGDTPLDVERHSNIIGQISELTVILIRISNERSLLLNHQTQNFQ